MTDNDQDGDGDQSSTEQASSEGVAQKKLRDRSRRLAGDRDIGVLATIDAEGYPYTSLVEVVFDGDDGFWLLLSDLAVHTRNLRRETRASLLLRGETGTDEEALANPRSSFIGSVSEVDHLREEIREPYLEAHPHAATYIDFSDFSFYRLGVEKVRFIAGFGQMGWIDGDRFSDGQDEG